MSTREIKEYQIQSFRKSTIYPLMTQLIKGVLHRTSIDGYKGIRQTGNILPNKGNFPFSYPQSISYYGFSMGYICLFDFESARDDDYRGNHHIWADFFYDHKPITIILRLNRQKLSDKLIPNSVRPKPVETDYVPAIAYVEAWYPEAISVSAIDSYIVTWLDSETRNLIFHEYSKDMVEELDELIDSIK
ncbi:MAG: hypothetical protein K8R37_14155 [Bacteroidales bacterium]|nr:hypothetical protein [Bacteroidales bacterium]